MSDKGDGMVTEGGDRFVKAVGRRLWEFVVVRWWIGEHGEAGEDFLIGFLLQLGPFFFII